jgi:hypothetical protein
MKRVATTVATADEIDAAIHCGETIAQQLASRAEAIGRGMRPWEADDRRELTPWYDILPHPWYSTGYTLQEVRNINRLHGRPVDEKAEAFFRGIET